jgi:hypothetical protein
VPHCSNFQIEVSVAKQAVRVVNDLRLIRGVDQIEVIDDEDAVVAFRFVDFVLDDTLVVSQARFDGTDLPLV